MDKVLDYSIDWLAFSFSWPYDEIETETGTYRDYQARNTRGWVIDTKQAQDIALNLCFPDKLYQKMDLICYETDMRMQNYDKVFMLKNNQGDIFAELGFHSQRPSQAIHCVLRGEYLFNMRVNGFPPEAFLTQIITNGAKLTRIDFALDVDTDTKPKDIYLKLKTGRKNTQNLKNKDFIVSEPLGWISVPAETVGYVENDFGLTGSGFYCGSPASSRRFRCYDKGAQLQLTRNWLRCEFKLSDDAAIAWGGMAALDLGSTINGLFLSYFKGWSQMEKWLLNLSQMKPDKLRKEDNRQKEKWLRTVAVPAVVQAIQRDTDYARQLNGMLLDALFGMMDKTQMKHSSLVRLQKALLSTTITENARFAVSQLPL